MTLTDKPALGIAEKSPQRPRKVGARTCNGKPDPCGNAQIKIKIGTRITTYYY